MPSAESDELTAGVLTGVSVVLVRVPVERRGGVTRRRARRGGGARRGRGGGGRVVGARAHELPHGGSARRSASRHTVHRCALSSIISANKIHLVTI